MSKTHRDKLRYQAKHRWKNEPPEYEWFGPFRIFLGHNKKDVHEPPWHRIWRYSVHSNHNNQAKYWHRWSNRKYRRLVKKLIKQERYGEIPLKPENVDWCIY